MAEDHREPRVVSKEPDLLLESVRAQPAQYTARSLVDIAEQYEALATDTDNRALHARTHRDGHALKAEARTWRAAAAMLRNTTLIVEYGDCPA